MQSRSEPRIWRLMIHHIPEYKADALAWSLRTGTLAVGWGQTGDLSDQRFANDRELTKIVAASHPGISHSAAAGAPARCFIVSRLAAPNPLRDTETR